MEDGEVGDFDAMTILRVAPRQRERDVGPQALNAGAYAG